MKNIKVTLQHHTPLHIASDGARTCWSSQDKSDTVDEYIGPKDLALLNRVGNEYKHASVLEHCVCNFFIDGISRGCLQELARHRIASLSVKSTRYTLKELKSEEHFTNYTDMNDQEYHSNGLVRATKYLVMIDSDKVNRMSILALDNLRDLLLDGISNDKAKYALPEAYRTQLTWTINLRSLQNFLTLRTSPAALPEIRHLGSLLYKILPPEIQSTLVHCLYKEPTT